MGLIPAEVKRRKCVNMNNKKIIGIAVLILVACFLTVAIVSYNVGYTIGCVTDNVNYKSVAGVYRCDRSTGTEALVLYEDGTYRYSDDHSVGTWTKNGDEIKLVDNSGSSERTAYIVGDGIGLIYKFGFWERVK